MRILGFSVVFKTEAQGPVDADVNGPYQRDHEAERPVGQPAKGSQKYDADPAMQYIIQYGARAGPFDVAEEGQIRSQNENRKQPPARPAHPIGAERQKGERQAFETLDQI